MGMLLSFHPPNHNLWIKELPEDGITENSTLEGCGVSPEESLTRRGGEELGIHGVLIARPEALLS